VLGPACGTLTVRTGKAGAASKAGHNLRMEVTDWHATLDLGDQPTLAVSVDPHSLRVIEGTGGVMPLGDEEKDAIVKTIDDDVLKGRAIEFNSSRVDVDASGHLVNVEGELQLFDSRRPVTFALRLDDDGHVEGTAKLKHSDFGVKPFSALFGTLKVADDVEVAVDATTRSQDDG
jgi:polyisoprenoid-binding protein YceI